MANTNSNTNNAPMTVIARHKLGDICVTTFQKTVTSREGKTIYRVFFATDKSYKTDKGWGHTNFLTMDEQKVAMSLQKMAVDAEELRRQNILAAAQTTVAASVSTPAQQ